MDLNKLYMDLQKSNLGRIDFGSIFYDEIDSSNIDDPDKIFSEYLDLLGYFDLYDNFYFPFNKVTYLATIETPGEKRPYKFFSTTFTDNPEHKYTSMVSFSSIVDNMFTVHGVMRICSINDNFIEEYLKQYPDEYIRYMDVGAVFDGKSKSNCEYRLLIHFKKVTVRETKTRKIFNIAITDRHRYYFNLFNPYFNKFFGSVAMGYSYFAKLLINPKLFVVEEKAAERRKDGSIRINKNKRSFFRTIDIKLLRSRYIKREGNGCSLKIGHERRRHTRTFRSDYYKNRKGETIIIEPVWVGPTETFDPDDDKLYKVRLDIG